MTRWAPIAKRIAKVALALAVLLIAAPYAWAPVYRFPGPVPFSGAHFYNPYAARPAAWQRANFHAHGRAWIGLTNGHQSDEEVARRYRELGYDVAGVSDYQYIAAHHGVATIPVYEHGFNITKQHQLAIGAHDVEWLDFVLWQSLSHGQYVIDRIKRKSDLVALAHPATRDAYLPADMESLTGYDLIEVVNGPFATPDVWDAALSAGRPVWAIADDDTHDLEDARRTEAGWNMVAASSASTTDIVEALRAGRTYAVLRTGERITGTVTTLESIDMHDDQLRVSLAGAPSTISFVGQNGVVRKIVKQTLTADYTWTDADTYIRTVVDSPQTVLFLSPVLRYDGNQLFRPVAQVDAASTWLLRGSMTLGLGIITWSVMRRRRPLSSRTPEAILSGANRNTA